MTIKELSYGIIPLRQKKDKWEVLIVCHKKGHCSFPKGHAEPDETPGQTASRELFEEVGLEIDLFLEFPSIQEHYFFKQEGVLISKTVIYFLAKVKGKLKCDPKEISSASWVELKEADKLCSYAESKAICEKLVGLLYN